MDIDTLYDGVGAELGDEKPLVIPSRRHNFQNANIKKAYSSLE